MKKAHATINTNTNHPTGMRIKLTHQSIPTPTIQQRHPLPTGSHQHPHQHRYAKQFNALPTPEHEGLRQVRTGLLEAWRNHLLAEVKFKKKPKNNKLFSCALGRCSKCVCLHMCVGEEGWMGVHSFTTITPLFSSPTHTHKNKHRNTHSPSHTHPPQHTIINTGALGARAGRGRDAASDPGAAFSPPPGVCGGLGRERAGAGTHGQGGPVVGCCLVFWGTNAVLRPPAGGGFVCFLCGLNGGAGA